MRCSPLQDIWRSPCSDALTLCHTLHSHPVRRNPSLADKGFNVSSCSSSSSKRDFVSTRPGGCPDKTFRLGLVGHRPVVCRATTMSFSWSCLPARWTTSPVLHAHTSKSVQSLSRLCLLACRSHHKSRHFHQDVVVSKVLAGRISNGPTPSLVVRTEDCRRRNSVKRGQRLLKRPTWHTSSSTTPLLCSGCPRCQLRKVLSLAVAPRNVTCAMALSSAKRNPTTSCDVPHLSANLLAFGVFGRLPKILR